MEEVNSKKMKEKDGLLALSPLLVFVVLYLVTSIIVQDFYKVPLTVAILTVGNIAKNIGNRFGVDHCKGASIPSTFACAV